MVSEYVGSKQKLLHGPNSQLGLSHPMDNANYSQKTYSNKFSAHGAQKYSDIAGYEIKTVDDLA